MWQQPGWEFRTAEGIAAALGTDMSEIEAIFDEYPGYGGSVTRMSESGILKEAARPFPDRPRG